MDLPPVQVNIRILILGPLLPQEEVGNRKSILNWYNRSGLVKEETNMDK